MELQRTEAYAFRVTPPDTVNSVVSGAPGQEDLIKLFRTARSAQSHHFEHAVAVLSSNQFSSVKLTDTTLTAGIQGYNLEYRTDLIRVHVRPKGTSTLPLMGAGGLRWKAVFLFRGGRIHQKSLREVSASKYVRKTPSRV